MLVHFFDPANFSGSNVKPMANNGARDHVSTATGRSQVVLILIQYISHLRLPVAKIWQRYSTSNSKRTVGDPKCDARRHAGTHADYDFNILV